MILQETAEKEKVQYIIQANWAVAADDGAGGGYIIEGSAADTSNNAEDGSSYINDEMMAAVVDPHKRWLEIWVML